MDDVVLKSSLDVSFSASVGEAFSSEVTLRLFLYNNRKKMNDFDRFKLAMTQIVGKRLTWDRLTGKLPEEETCVN